MVMTVGTRYGLSTLSCHFMSCHVMSYDVMFLLCPILLRPVQSCPVLAVTNLTLTKPFCYTRVRDITSITSSCPPSSADC